MVFIQRLIAAPWACYLFAGVAGVFGCLLLRGLAGELLQMHRSKIARKKLYKSYSLWDRLLLKPAWEHCIHARRFCRKVIVLHHVHGILLMTMLFLGIVGFIMPQVNTVGAFLAIGMAALLDIPIYIGEMILSKFSFRRRWQGYRFRKYHNTVEYERLL